MGLIQYPKGKYARLLLEVLSAWPPVPITGKTQNIRTHQNAITKHAVEAARSAVDRANLIEALSGRATTLSSFLSVIKFMDADHQNDALHTCASMAEEMAMDVAFLTGINISINYMDEVAA